MIGRMRWANTWAIVRREYLERVRSRWFAVMTVLIPAFMFGSMLLPMLMSERSGTERRVIAISDATGVLADSIAAALISGAATYTVEFRDVADDELARELVRLQAYDALVMIPADVFTGGRAEYFVRGTPRFREIRRVERVLDGQIRSMRLWRAGLGPEEIERVLSRVALNPVIVGTDGGEQSARSALTGTALMAMMMYFTLILYGAWTLRGVLRDKTSRVVEILVSTVSPTSLMFGKILGIGAVGLTQIGIWISALIAVGRIAPVSPVGQYVTALSGPAIPAFVTFYVTGYLLFAALYAGIGAICSNEDDAQQLQLPVMLLIMVPIFLLGTAISDPDRPLIVALSFVPFFSPVLMLLRILTGSASWTEFAISVTGIVATTGLAAWLSGRLFRVGILMTGKRPTLREIWRWMREA